MDTAVEVVGGDGDQGEGAGAGHCAEGGVAEALGGVGEVDGVGDGSALVPAAVAIAVGAGTQLASAAADEGKTAVNLA